MRSDKVFFPACLALLLVTGSCRRETKDEKFRHDFEQYTEKECPKFVDPCTRLDSACYDTGSRTLSYHYSVQDILDDEAVYTDETTASFRDNILKGLKGSLQLKPYKDEGITFRYAYRSITTGRMLLELTFSPEDYGN